MKIDWEKLLEIVCYIPCIVCRHHHLYRGAIHARNVVPVRIAQAGYAPQLDAEYIYIVLYCIACCLFSNPQYFPSIIPYFTGSPFLHHTNARLACPNIFLSSSGMYTWAQILRNGCIYVHWMAWVVM